MVSRRKHKISRLEEFSDAVFGFALTLLVITANGPRSYGELAAPGSFGAKTLAGHDGVSAAVGLFAMLFARLGPRELAFLSPSSFALMGPGHWLYGRRSERRRTAFIARMSGATVGVA